MITGINTIEVNNTQFQEQLLGTQFMITGLLLEYIMVAFYSECNEVLKKVDKPILDCLIDILTRKFSMMNY